jgi:Kef-type K+ transport system membrane component KefB
VAEAVVTPLGAAWSPVVLAVLAFLVAVTSYALLLRAGVGQQAAVGLRSMPRFGAASAVATLRTNPSGGLLALLAPAILQAIVFAIVLLLVVLVSRRRRAVRTPDSGEDQRLPALGA